MENYDEYLKEGELFAVQDESGDIDSLWRMYRSAGLYLFQENVLNGRSFTLSRERVLHFLKTKQIVPVKTKAGRVK